MSWLLAQDPLSVTEWAKLIVQLGLPTVLVVYFVWDAREREKRVSQEARDRENRMASRIDILEDFQRTQLVEINKQTTAALLEDAAASRANIVMISELKAELKDHHALAVVIDKKLSAQVVQQGER